jgi:glycosyltransferase involved in cell wall biosynthesis
VKLLRVICSINPASGGPVEGLKSSSLALTKLGHNTEVACLDSSEAPWLKSFPLKVYALGPGLGKYNFSSKFVPWMRVHTSDYDCIIVDGIWQYSSFGTWLALRNTQIPYFVYPHGMLDPWFKRTYPLKHLKKWLYWPWADYRVLRDARAVLFTCYEEQILARQSFWLYQCNEVIAGYGTACPTGDAAHQRHIFLSQFPELQHKHLVLFLGRIHPKKGCDLLIESFARVANSDKTLHLVMAGPDQISWQKQLQKLAEQLKIDHRITWTGQLTGDSKWGALHAADVFVLPSHQENFGVAVAEAMACGVPVLISHKVNIWREILADEAGFAANDDLEGITDLLQNWLSLSTNEKLLIKQRAKQCFMKRFEIDQVARGIINALNSYGVGGE